MASTDAALTSFRDAIRCFHAGERRLEYLDARRKLAAKAE
jgi:hypothetical protein